jgi:hypothetical protein
MIIRTPPKLTSKNGVVNYIEVNLWSWLRDLYTGLFKISFKDNFQAFLVKDLTILAGQQVAITNEFKNIYPGQVPSGRIITRQQGNGIILDGDTQWTSSFVYLNNPSANDVTITILFFL